MAQAQVTLFPNLKFRKGGLFFSKFQCLISHSNGAIHRAGLATIIIEFRQLLQSSLYRLRIQLILVWILRITLRSPLFFTPSHVSISIRGRHPNTSVIFVVKPAKFSEIVLVLDLHFMEQFERGLPSRTSSSSENRLEVLVFQYSCGARDCTRRAFRCPQRSSTAPPKSYSHIRQLPRPRRPPPGRPDGRGGGDASNERADAASERRERWGFNADN